MFGGIASLHFYHLYSYSTSAASCLFNVTLIYAISVTPLHHVVYIDDVGTILIAYQFIHQSTAIGLWSLLCWVFLFYQTFVILSFHYIYRYIVLCKPSWLRWIQQNARRNWASLAIVVDLVFAGLIVMLCYTCFFPTLKSRQAFAAAMLESFNVDLFADNLPGFVAFTYESALANGERGSQKTVLIALISAISAQFATVFVIVFCLVSIMREIRTGGGPHLQSKTRLMQRQLFRALLWQANASTIIPVCTTYTPCALMMITPLVTQVALGGTWTLALMPTQLFPMIDPFLILYFIPRYRAALPRIIHIDVAPVTMSRERSTDIVQNAGNQQ